MPRAGRCPTTRPHIGSRRSPDRILRKVSGAAVTVVCVRPRIGKEYQP